MRRGMMGQRLTVHCRAMGRGSKEGAGLAPAEAFRSAFVFLSALAQT